MECGQCGARFAVTRGASSVQCAHCRRATRVERHSAVHGAAGFVRSVFTNIGRTRPHPGYPPVHGNKRALLVGINYTGTAAELPGPINDVKCMSFLLTLKYGFPGDCVLVLTDEERDPYRRPTRANILVAMRWLVHGCSCGDSLVFHFSGHGDQEKDKDGDEQDGQDEVICPLDWQLNGAILDDEINEAIVRPLVQGVKLHAIIDACRSGTVLDLPNLCQIKKNGKPQWMDHSAPNGAWKNTSGGHAILISGCTDDEDAQDGYGHETMAMGALTYSFFAAAWFAHRPPTYGAFKDKGDPRRLQPRHPDPLRPPCVDLFLPHVRKVVNFSGVQEPQLSSSDKFDINRKTFML